MRLTLSIRPCAALYRAAQTPAGLIAYGRFFVHISFHLLFCVWMVLGLPRVGEWAAGVFCMISWFSLGSPKGTALGFFAIANIGLWSLVRRGVRACVGARCNVCALLLTCAFARAQTGLLSLAVMQQAAVKFRTGGGFAEMKRQKAAAQQAAAMAGRV